MTTRLILLLVVSALPLQAILAEEVCLGCHADVGDQLGVFHARSETSCTNCHGESAGHLGNPRVKPDIVFSRERSALHAGDDSASGSCLSCHDDAQMTHWSTAGHGDAGVSCHSCHKVHARKDPMLSRTSGSETCLGCHRDVEAKFRMPSTHPVEEGKVQCTSCHAPHGSASDSMLAGHGTVDTCVDCHKDLRGPFLFEHEPVTEDCGLCHEPHGSVIPAMLNTRPTFLCQSCHIAANHPSRLPDGSALSLRDSNLVVRGCVNCHSQVHGSNHPSGARLMR